MTLFLLGGAMADGIGSVYGICSSVAGVCDVEIKVVQVVHVVHELRRDGEYVFGETQFL